MSWSELYELYFLRFLLRGMVLLVDVVERQGSALGGTVPFLSCISSRTSRVSRGSRGSRVSLTPIEV